MAFFFSFELAGDARGGLELGEREKGQKKKRKKREGAKVEKRTDRRTGR